MNTKKQYFHFTIGPVQGFVAQARRTRDFWAGSFILSWLSAVAMRAVRAQGGNVLFPAANENYLKWLEGDGKGNPPALGSVPNRFKAEVLGAFNTEQIGKTVYAAWRAIAEVVWKADLEPSAGPKSRSIWDRQIENFWDIQWALLDEEEAANTLDRMKNWRTHLPPDEPGLKCMMMDGWQELSGAERPGRESEEFWKAIRKSAMATDFRDNEMLCAIAFVKRRFASHFKNLRADMPGGWTLVGWQVPSGVPSVHYMAAAPWLAKLFEVANLQNTANGKTIHQLLGEFHDAARGLTGQYGEWDSNIKCIKDADVKKQWKALDGTVFFDSMLENRRLWAEKATEAQDVLDKLKKLRGVAKLEPVSPFYAVLLMDGDELGIHMSEPSKQQTITASLASFTEKVPRIVQENNGFLIYAGGDDVLALLPLEDALACAIKLREHYLCCFEKTDIRTTLSGAIEYVYLKMPLGKVLHDAHDLLDNLAKEWRGRDAIACKVWKPGGPAVVWAMPWECALDDSGRVVVDQLAEDFRMRAKSGDEDMANKFFYRIREHFDLLNPPNAGGQSVLTDQEAQDLLVMEYHNSGLVRGKTVTMKDAEMRVKLLLDQCRPVFRDKNKTAPDQWPKSERLEADGALLIRFLAQKGVER